MKCEHSILSNLKSGGEQRFLFQLYTPRSSTGKTNLSILSAEPTTCWLTFTATSLDLFSYHFFIE